MFLYVTVWQQIYSFQSNSYFSLSSSSIRTINISYCVSLSIIEYGASTLSWFYLWCEVCDELLWMFNMEKHRHSQRDTYFSSYFLMVNTCENTTVQLCFLDILYKGPKLPLCSYTALLTYNGKEQTVFDLLFPQTLVIMRGIDSLIFLC